MTSYRHCLFIDECLAQTLSDSYLEPHTNVVGVAVQIQHYVEKFGQNCKLKDHQFIPRLAKDRRWFVLSADSGRSLWCLAFRGRWRLSCRCPRLSRARSSHATMKWTRRHWLSAFKGSGAGPNVTWFHASPSGVWTALWTVNRQQTAKEST